MQSITVKKIVLWYGRGSLPRVVDLEGGGICVVEVKLAEHFSHVGLLQRVTTAKEGLSDQNILSI